MFELSVTPKQSENIEFLAAALDDRKIDRSVCNAVTWHRLLVDQGPVTNDDKHSLSEVACGVCDMVNVKWSIDEDTVDTVEALVLGAKGVYS